MSVGPIVPARVLKRLHLAGQGRADGKIDVSIGVDGEPGVLPARTCSGDLVEPEVAKTLSTGALAGIESRPASSIPSSPAASSPRASRSR